MEEINNTTIELNNGDHYKQKKLFFLCKLFFMEKKI